MIMAAKAVFICEYEYLVNDSVSNPGLTTTPNLVLSIFSPDDSHKKLVDVQFSDHYWPVLSLSLTHAGHRILPLGAGQPPPHGPASLHHTGGPAGPSTCGRHQPALV